MSACERTYTYQVLGDESRLPLSMVLDSAAVPEFARDALHACLDCILVTFVWKSTWRGLDSLPYLSAWYQVCGGVGGWEGVVKWNEMRAHMWAQMSM